MDGKTDKVGTENNENKIHDKENSEVTGENVSAMNADVTETGSMMDVSTPSMDTEKLSYKESDGVTSESWDTNISLQYLTDEGKNNRCYEVEHKIIRLKKDPYFVSL